jgi:hypothetical protein
MKKYGKLAAIFLGVGLILAFSLAALSAKSQAQTGAFDTSFTYQGRLLKDGAYVSDTTCDFTFNLYDAPSNGTLLGTSPQAINGVTLTDGYFTVELDFGDVFDGQQRFLEVIVDCGNPGDPTNLGRIKLYGAPFSLYAIEAITATIAQQVESVSWTSIPDKPSGFADNIDNDLLDQVTDGGTCNVNGEVIKFSSGTWLCSTDNDQLRELSGGSQCSNDQYVYYDGATWQCEDKLQVSASSGLTLTSTVTDDLVLDINPSFKLPQNCAADQIPKFANGAWSCGDDVDTTYTAGTGIDSSQLANSQVIELVSSYRLPQCTNLNDVPKWDDTSSSWTCQADDNVTLTTADGTTTASTGGANGQSTLVARGDHHHFGQTWSGPSGVEGLVIESEGAPALVVIENSNSGPIFEVGNGSDREFYVDNLGDVFADGGYNCGNSINDVTLANGTASGQNESSLNPCLSDDSPADFAEMLPAAQIEEMLVPGDVLVVDPDGQLARSGEAYQPTVVGVYSTRPSYLGNSQFAGEDGYAPLALVGVVPVKASDENGSIQPGDMLVASNTPGHAMRAGDTAPNGTVIGKALAPLEEGTGLIQMIVMLQ